MVEERRTDEDILADVRDALTWDSRIDDRFIRVNVHNGVVTLSGSVNTLGEKSIVHDVVSTIKGVALVIDRTQIRPVEIKEDDGIAADLRLALKSDPRVDESHISVEVGRGVATISGEVGTAAEERAAVEDAWYTLGVTSVINNLKILPPEVRSDAEVEVEVRNSIVGDSRITEPSLILVKSRNGKVYLRGGVASPNERVAAGQDAWSIPGVVDVVNELAVISYSYG